MIPNEPERPLNMNQLISSLQTVRQFVESVEGANTIIFEAIEKLENVLTFTFIYLS
jgi:hypothetical protein